MALTIRTPHSKQRYRTLAQATLAVVAMATVTAGVAHTQVATDQPVALELNGVRATGLLHVTGAGTRQPVVLLVTDADAVPLAAALGTERVASLRLDGRTGDPDTLAQWISFLRNDERFPVVVVFADAGAFEAGVVAARAARADGIVKRGDSAGASELARVVAAVTVVDGRSPGDIARQIAQFARSVPALGRRGTSPVRTLGRKSLRHTVMASVGGARVSIEWGQPEMRGRTIWGELVPWGRVWMPGADEATVLTTDAAMTIGTVDVPAGDHTFYTLPGPDRFQLLISRDVGQFHTVYDPAMVIGRADMSLQAKTESTEGLTFAIQPAADGRSASIALSWDQREYAVRLTVR